MPRTGSARPSAIRALEEARLTAATWSLRSQRLGGLQLLAGDAYPARFGKLSGGLHASPVGAATLELTAFTRGPLGRPCWVLRGACSPARSYFTSERRRNSSPKTSGSTIQIAVVEPSMAHSLAVSVPPSNSATCV